MASFDPNTEYDVLSVGEWLITLIILAIPVVNIVMLFVWGFGSSPHPTRRNYARASLILYAIIIGFVMVLALFGAFVGASSGLFT